MSCFLQRMRTLPSVVMITAAAAAVVPAFSPSPEPAQLTFVDVSGRSGITAVLRNSPTPEKHQIETMPGGVAVFDFDNDGRPDLFFTNGARQPDLKKTGPDFWNRLYRNRGDGTFEDVTARAGVAGEGFSMAAATADFNNDGFPDLFVAGVHRNILYRNRGDGTFEDVTVKAGIRSEVWSIGAGWFDYDNDGLLDLFVVNYVEWEPAKEPFCGDPDGKFRTYCHPRFYRGLPNTLYHNNGDGTFSDVSESSGIAQHIGKGMSVAFADYDHDGLMDVFVTNDTVPNFLFHNEGHGRFREAGAQAGVGLNDDGRALSSMGVDFRDVDNDGREDVFLTALANETFPLYHGLAHGLFADITYRSRIGAATMALSGWSCGIFDFDNDGWKDLFAAGGDVQDNTETYSSRKSRLPNIALRNHAGVTFAPFLLGVPALHRGAAFADFDGDGRIDAVVTRLGQPPLLLRNTTEAAGNWLAFQLRGTRSNRDGLGARIRITVAGREQWNHATTAVGYASSSSPVVHFGLGQAKHADAIGIQWPSGITQHLGPQPANRVVAVTEP